jgi:hypothetical protein
MKMNQTEKACAIVGGIMSFIGIPLILIIIPADVQYFLGNSDALMDLGKNGMCMAACVVSYICLLILGLGVYLDGCE